MRDNDYPLALPVLACYTDKGHYLYIGLKDGNPLIRISLWKIHKEDMSIANSSH